MGQSREPSDVAAVLKVDAQMSAVEGSRTAVVAESGVGNCEPGAQFVNRCAKVPRARCSHCSQRHHSGSPPLWQCASSGATVVTWSRASQALYPGGGVMAIATGALPTGIGVPAVIDVSANGMTTLSPSMTT